MMNDYQLNCTADPATIVLEKLVLHEALAKLKHNQRKVLVYKIIYGYKFEELSEMWKIPIGKLTYLYKVARQKMKKLIT